MSKHTLIRSNPQTKDEVWWWSVRHDGGLTQLRYTFYVHISYEELTGDKHGGVSIANQWWVEQRDLTPRGLAPWRSTGRADTQFLCELIHDSKPRTFAEARKAALAQEARSEQHHRERVEEAIETQAWLKGITEP